MNNIIRNIIFTFLMLILSSCSTFILKKLKYKSLNDEWDILYYTPSWSEWKMGFLITNKNIPFLEIRLDNFRSTYKEMYLFWLFPIPIIDSYSTNYKNCNFDFYLNFEIYLNTNKKYDYNFNINSIKYFFKTNNILFDTSKLFILKDNKKYKMELVNFDQNTISKPSYLFNIQKKNSDNILNISHYMLNKINNHKTKLIKVSSKFNSIFGCRALENTKIIIDGLSINNKLLNPIEIELKY